MSEFGLEAVRNVDSDVAVFEVADVFVIESRGVCSAAGRMVSGVIRPRDILVAPSGQLVEVLAIEMCGRPDAIPLIFAMKHAPLFNRGTRLVAASGAPDLAD